MKRNSNKTVATETEAQNVDASAQNTDDTAAQAAFDAEADAARDPFFATFNVVAKTVLNSPARASHGEEVTFNVTRQRKGAYTATYTPAGEGVEPVTGKLSRKPDVAVRAVIRAIGSREAEFMFDAMAAEAEHAPIPEDAGDNQPEGWFFDEETEIAARLNKVAEHVREADTLLTSANKNTREGWLGFGRAYNEAKAIFAEAGLSGEGEGEAAKRGKTAWGVWLRTRFAGSENVEAILAKKNAAAQAGFFATAPVDLIDAYGSQIAPSTFMRKSEEAAAEFGAAVAETIMAQRMADESDDKTLSTEQALAAAAEKLTAREAAYSAAKDAWQKEATKAAEKGKTPPVFADGKKAAPLAMVRWLFDTAGDDFGKSKLGKAIVKAWDAETTKPSEEERTEREATKATAAIVKKFADMSTDDAARHLLHILVAHEAPDMVLEALGDMLVDWQNAEAEKAAAAKSKAEAEAADA